ncbi:MAG TPA: hypothetical protein VF220_05705 [Nitrososphaeraceae archaeon]
MTESTFYNYICTISSIMSPLSFHGTRTDELRYQEKKNLALGKQPIWFPIGPDLVNST